MGLEVGGASVQTSVAPKLLVFCQILFYPVHVQSDILVPPEINAI